MASDFPFSKKSFRLPFWAQLSIGLAIIATILIVVMSSNPFVSAWDEENSRFYNDAGQALRMFSIHPTAPTAFIFWDKDDPSTLTAIRALATAPSTLRIYGIHVSTSNDQVKIRQEWLKHAPKSAVLILDRSQLLQTSFHVRQLPMVFIMLPKQKKIYSYLGNVNDNREPMLEIIASEY